VDQHRPEAQPAPGAIDLDTGERQCACDQQDGAARPTRIDREEEVRHPPRRGEQRRQHEGARLDGERAIRRAGDAQCKQTKHRGDGHQDRDGGRAQSHRIFSF